MEKISVYITVLFSVFILCSCGTNKSEHQFIGKFQDEFGNKFELKEDMTATIEFVNTNKITHTTWTNTEADDYPYAAIEYNGNPEYFLLQGDGLYRHVEDMKNNRRKVIVTRQE